MTILVAHDGSEQADKALTKALSLAASAKASIVILAVVPDLCMMELSDDECKKMYSLMMNESRNRLTGIIDELTGEGIEIESDVVFGNATEMILQVSAEKKVDMIVVGSHGRHGAKKFLLGSVSTKVVNHATCDVLVVKC